MNILVELTIAALLAPSNFPEMGDAYVALFNSNENDRKKGEEAVKEMHGEESWGRIQELTSNGVMGIFEAADVTLETAFFVHVVGRSVEERMKKVKVEN